jgi:hypothetical protein
MGSGCWGWVSSECFENVNKNNENSELHSSLKD